jgi:hypothetical protein
MTDTLFNQGQPLARPVLELLPVSLRHAYGDRG